jgi:uncharacterized protein YegJ (DUF2314 family)
MRVFVVAGAVIAVICVGAIQVANSRLEQTRVRAADVNKETPKSADDRRIVNDNVVAYATANEALAEARRKARDTLPRFVSLLKSGMKATFTVKFPLTQNGQTEHIWLQVADVQHDLFIGRLANEPVNGSKYKIGQFMTVARSDVEDWMVRTPVEIYGAYTTRYALKDIPKPQAELMARMFRD